MDPQIQEDLRRLVRKFYADRPATAHNVTAAQFGIRLFLPCTDPEVLAACVFLLDLGQLKEIENKLGSLRYFQITAAGTLAHERDE